MTQILRVPGGVSEQEEVQVQVTRLLVESYFDVVRKNLQDAVPKAVMHFLVNSVQRGLQQHLIRTLYRCGRNCSHSSLILSAKSSRLHFGYSSYANKANLATWSQMTC